jgi:hypothetical protein
MLIAGVFAQRFFVICEPNCQSRTVPRQLGENAGFSVQREIAVRRWKSSRGHRSDLHADDANDHPQGSRNDRREEQTHGRNPVRVGDRRYGHGNRGLGYTCSDWRNSHPTRVHRHDFRGHDANVRRANSQHVIHV